MSQTLNQKINQTQINTPSEKEGFSELLGIVEKVLCEMANEYGMEIEKPQILYDLSQKKIVIIPAITKLFECFDEEEEEGTLEHFKYLMKKNGVEINEIVETRDKTIIDATFKKEKEDFLAEHERKALEILEKTTKCMDLVDDVKYVFKALRDAVIHAERKSKESIHLLLTVRKRISQIEQLVKERTKIETDEYIEYETEDYEDFMIVMEEAIWKTAEKVHEKLTQ